jgi:hypothetical protein
LKIITLKKKLKKEVLWAVKIILPIKKYLKAKQYQRSQVKVILDYNKTCDNIRVRQQNMGTEGIYERKLLITERKILRRILGPTKKTDSTWRCKVNDELNYLV